MIRPAGLVKRFSTTRGSSRAGPRGDRNVNESARVGSGGVQVSRIGSGRPVPARPARSPDFISRQVKQDKHATGSGQDRLFDEKKKSQG